MQRYHRLRHLEDGARRILRLQGTVKQGLGYVVVQVCEILATNAAYQQVGVIARS